MNKRIVVSRFSHLRFFALWAAASAEIDYAWPLNWRAAAAPSPSFFNEQRAYTSYTPANRSPRTLGDLPLVVVRRGRPITGYPGLSAEQQENFRENEPIWYQLQQELAELSTRSTTLIAEQSGHEIAQEQPEIVVEAIQSALSTLNKNQGVFEFACVTFRSWRQTSMIAL